MNKIISVFLFTSCFYSMSFADEACVSGNPNQKQLIDALAKAKTDSPITQIIFQKYELAKKLEAEPCPTCNTPTQAKPPGLQETSNALSQLPAAPKTLFKLACLEAANKNVAGVSEIACKDGKSSIASKQCLTKDFLTYQSAVISNFLTCAKKLNVQTLTPESLFKKYSQESTFKPQYASGSGVGLGQLTPIFVADIHQKWRGFPILEKFAKSELDECKAASHIAKKDLNNGLSLSLRNPCPFISVGEGLERNILYSLVGTANIWEKDLNPLLKTYLEKYKAHPQIEEVINQTLLNAYGRNGQAGARALFNRLKHLTPDAYLNIIKRPLGLKNGSGLLNSGTAYNNELEKRQLDIKNNLTEPLKSQFSAEGTKACLTPQ